MNVLDVFIGIPLIWITYKGFKKGFVVEIATLLALILGVYGALHFSDFTAGIIRNKLDYDSKYMGTISFIVTFLIIIVAVNFLGKAMNSLVEAVALGMLNRLFGAAFGLAKGALIVSIVVYLVDYVDQKTGVIPQEKKSRSILYEPMEKAAETLFDIFDSNFWGTKDKWKKKMREKLPVDVSL